MSARRPPGQNGMRFVDEYRDADKAQALSARIAGLCEPGRVYRLMEVCGGHTYTIYKHGLEDYLPQNITLVHGPGCPVCVIPMGRVDDAIAIAEQPDVILTSFGDMMRVPGGRGSFFDATAVGADIRMVYSPLDALKVARANPGKRVVFLGIGFETTAPATAMTVLRAKAEGIENFSVFCNHVTVVPAIKAILDSDCAAHRHRHRTDADRGCRPRTDPGVSEAVVVTCTSGSEAAPAGGGVASCGAYDGVANATTFIFASELAAGFDGSMSEATIPGLPSPVTSRNVERVPSNVVPSGTSMRRFAPLTNAAPRRK